MAGNRTHVSQLLSLLLEATGDAGATDIKVFYSSSSDCHRMQPKTWSGAEEVIRSGDPVLELYRSVHEHLSSRGPLQSDDDFRQRLRELLRGYTATIDDFRLISNNDSISADESYRKMSIYIFTDGETYFRDPEGDAELFRRLSGKLLEAGLHREEIGIQFIVFGKDEWDARGSHSAQVE